MNQDSNHSHFSFTRNLYDSCALEKKNQESEAPFKWVTDTFVSESNDNCFSEQSPFMHNHFRSIPFEKVDIESDLRGQTYKTTRCPSKKFDASKYKEVKNVLIECQNDKLAPEYTRINKSCNIFSGININRFDPLIEVSQSQDFSKIQSNDYIGINTRNTIKDKIKPN